MKTKFSKILGVGLTIALLTSLLITAAPVSALGVPTVTFATVGDAVISEVDADYSLSFVLGKELSGGDATVTLGAAYSLPDIGDAFTITEAVGADSGTIVWGAGSVTATPTGTAAVSGTAATLSGTAYSLPDVDDAFTITAVAATDTATLTINAGTYGVAMSGTGTYTALTGVIAFAAIGETAIVTSLTVPCNGTWVQSGSPTYAVTAEAEWLVSVTISATGNIPWRTAAIGDTVKVAAAATTSTGTTTVAGAATAAVTTDADWDSITVTFPVGTVIDVTANITAKIAASDGWIIGSWASPIISTSTVFTSSVTPRTITFTLTTVGDAIGQAATVLISITDGITNPGISGTNTLTVKTSKETTAVTSAAYTITNPIILPLAGVVSRYNSLGVLMFQYSSIGAAITAAASGDVIQVGPGTYDETITIGKSITLIGDAATTIIKDTDGDKGVTTGDGTVTITFQKTPLLAGVVFDGFTVMGDLGGATALSITGVGVTVQNCVFTKAGTATTAVAQTMVIVNPAVAATTYGNTITNCIFDTTLGAKTDTAIDVQAGFGENTTISGDSTFSVDGSDTAIAIADGTAAKPVKVTDVTISGVSGNGVVVTGASTVATITDSNLSNLKRALSVTAGKVTVTGSTIDTCGLAKTTTVAAQAAIIVNSTAGLSIISSTISNSPNEIIQVTANSNLVNMMFNNLTGNTLGVDNNDTVANTLNVTHNWWGAATGPATGMNVGTTTGKIDATAYLGGEATGTFTSAAVASLLKKTTVGVDVTLNTATVAGDIIGVANYAANPQAATPYPALDGGFYDVYLKTATAMTSVLIKFYNANITANTDVYVWGTLKGGWQAVTAANQGVNLFSGYVWVRVTGSSIPAVTDLAGTPFALVESPVAAAGIPALTAPKTGAKDVSLTPTLAWDPVSGAIGYDFELADNALFVVPLVKLDGDLGRLIVPFYQQVADLDYSTHYYWRVKTVSATATSAWSTSVFSTIAEPAVEPDPEARMWTCPQCGLTYSTRAKLEAHAGWAHLPEEPADIIIKPPDIEVIVPLPDVAAPITPAWIYIIIGVGAVLVISVVVLIVRTRRVA